MILCGTMMPPLESCFKFNLGAIEKMVSLRLSMQECIYLSSEPKAGLM